jgi:hypothetical protein
MGTLVQQEGINSFKHFMAYKTPSCAMTKTLEQPAAAWNWGDADRTRGKRRDGLPAATRDA